MDTSCDWSREVGVIGRRIIAAADNQRGLRLSAEECRLLALDMRNWEVCYETNDH